MKFLNTIFRILVFFIAFHCFSQEQNNEYHLYFDENGKNIASLEYLKKCTSFLYKCDKKIKDSIYVNSMIELYKFDKLSKSELFQLKYLLARDSKSNNFDDKTIIINFKNTILGYSEERKRMDSLANSPNRYREDYFEISESYYDNIRRLFDKRQKKCHKKYLKKSIKPLYFYKDSKGYNYNYESFEWHKLSKPLYALFFTNRRSGMVIIKPDGNYFQYHNIPTPYVDKLLTDDWEPYIKDYNIAKINLLKERNGIFKDMFEFAVAPKTFYIDKRKNKTANTDLLNVVPIKAIRVNSSSGVDQYFNNLRKNRCFTYGSY